MAHYDVLLSQEEVTLRQQDLLEAQNTFSEHAQSLKAKISKSFNEELATVEVIPSDRLPDPHSDDVPALAEALQEAASHRPEIEQADLSLRNQQIAIQATRNSLLPSLDVYASYYPSGLDGALRPTFGNIFQNDFPNLSYGVMLNLPISQSYRSGRRRMGAAGTTAIANKAPECAGLCRLGCQQGGNRGAAGSGPTRCRAELVTLARQVHEMQHQKFTLALATVEDVITAQRNLAAAQSHVVIARAIYAKTLIQYELATGTLLDRRNNVLFEVIDGDVHRVPNIPGTPELAN